MFLLNKFAPYESYSQLFLNEIGVAEYHYDCYYSGYSDRYYYYFPGVTTWIFLYVSVLLVPFLFCTDTRKFLDIQDTASPFKVTRGKNGLFGITKWEKKCSSLLLGLKYDNISPINDDTFICERGGLYGVYNATKKKMVIPVECENIKVEGNRILAARSGVVSVCTDRGYRVVE